jgi:hypothetical protein
MAMLSAQTKPSNATQRNATWKFSLASVCQTAATKETALGLGVLAPPVSSLAKRVAEQARLRLVDAELRLVHPMTPSFCSHRAATPVSTSMVDNVCTERSDRCVRGGTFV